MQKTGEENNQLSVLEQQLQLLEGRETYENLPECVSLRLLGLMKSVTKEVNPQSVNAACNCASEIHKMLKLSVMRNR